LTWASTWGASSNGVHLILPLLDQLAMMCTVFNKSSITEPVCIVLWRQSGLVMHNVIVVLDLGWYL
jgi:hypothetical protein